jgi:hypothetical protein
MKFANTVLLKASLLSLTECVFQQSNSLHATKQATAAGATVTQFYTQA